MACCADNSPMVIFSERQTKQRGDFREQMCGRTLSFFHILWFGMIQQDYRSSVYSSSYNLNPRIDKIWDRVTGKDTFFFCDAIMVICSPGGRLKKLNLSKFIKQSGQLFLGLSVMHHLSPSVFLLKLYFEVT